MAHSSTDYPLADYLAQMPLIAILRGLKPADALAVGEILIETGFRIIEVPMNSPEPIKSIKLLADAYGKQALIGAGTVMTIEHIAHVNNAGGRLIVMPHCDKDIVTAAGQYGLVCLPGVTTPSEGFAALKAGAKGLKLFPAEMVTPSILKAWRAVFPEHIVMLPVGGISTANMSDYWQAGASGFGLGSALFKADMSPAEIRTAAQEFVAEMTRLMDSQE